jgi:hypothetical protein
LPTLFFAGALFLGMARTLCRIRRSHQLRHGQIAHAML